MNQNTQINIHAEDGEMDNRQIHRSTMNLFQSMEEYFANEEEGIDAEFKTGSRGSGEEVASVASVFMALLPIATDKLAAFFLGWMQKNKCTIEMTVNTPNGDINISYTSKTSLEEVKKQIQQAKKLLEEA